MLPRPTRRISWKQLGWRGARCASGPGCGVVRSARGRPGDAVRSVRGCPGDALRSVRGCPVEVVCFLSLGRWQALTRCCELVGAGRP